MPHDESKFIVNRHHIAIIIPGGIDKDNHNYIPALHALLKHLAAKNSITVFSLHRFIAADHTESNPYRVISTNKTNKDGSFWYILKLMYKIVREHQEKRFDLINGFWGLPQGFMAVILAKFLRVKSVVSLRGGEFANLPEINYGSQVSPIRKALILWTCKRSDRLICLSRFIKNKMDMLDIRTQTNIIPTGHYASELTVEKRTFHRPLRLLSVANIHSVKNHAMILDCVHHLKKTNDVQLKIVGFNHLKKEMAGKIESLQLNADVELIDYTENDDLEQYYEWTDIFIHTSFYEAQAVVIVEAISKNVLLAGSNVGLLHDLGEEAAIISDQAQELAEKILATVQDLEKVESLKKKAYEWAKIHDIHWTVSQYSKLYQEMLND